MDTAAPAAVRTDVHYFNHAVASAPVIAGTDTQPSLSPLQASRDGSECKSAILLPRTPFIIAELIYEALV